MEHLLEGLVVLESIRGVIQLHAGELGFTTSEERFRESAAGQGHLRIEAAGDLEFNPGLVEPMKREGREAEFPGHLPSGLLPD